MKPLIFIKKEIHIDIFNYKFQKLGELKKNIKHNKYDLYVIKGRYISIDHLKEILKYHDKNLIEDKNGN